MSRRRTMRVRRATGGETGSIAAEFAIVLPAVIVVLALAAGVLAACGLHVRLQDAAADAARLAARGEPAGRVTSAVSSAVSGAVAGIERRADLVCIAATVDFDVVGVVSVPLRATSCALDGGL